VEESYQRDGLLSREPPSGVTTENTDLGDEAATVALSGEAVRGLDELKATSGFGKFTVQWLGITPKFHLLGV